MIEHRVLVRYSVKSIFFREKDMSKSAVVLSRGWSKAAERSRTGTFRNVAYAGV